MDILSQLKDIARNEVLSINLNKFITFGDVYACIRTEAGNIYTGINIDSACSIGFCAEHSAVAEMLKNGEYVVTHMLAVNKYGEVIPPCGRCRELVSQLSMKNKESLVEVEEGKVLKLKDLLPYDWKYSKKVDW